jgi:hypothetical protein
VRAQALLLVRALVLVLVLVRAQAQALWQQLVQALAPWQHVEI